MRLPRSKTWNICGDFRGRAELALNLLNSCREFFYMKQIHTLKTAILFVGLMSAPMWAQTPSDNSTNDQNRGSNIAYPDSRGSGGAGAWGLLGLAGLLGLLRPSARRTTDTYGTEAGART